MAHAECCEVKMEHTQSSMEIIKQTMLKHEAMFKEQVRMLHRLYQVQCMLMAEARDTNLAVFASSAHPASCTSSSLSSFTTETMKSLKWRNFLESSSKTIHATDQERSCNQEQEPFFRGNNMLFQDKVNSEVMKHSRDAERPAFNLEHPAEDCIDDEVQKENFQEGDVLISVSMPFKTPAVEISGEPSKVCSSFDTGYIKGVIEKNDRRSHLLELTSSVGEIVKENSFVLEHPKCNLERDFFTSLKKDGHIQQFQCIPTQLSTKVPSGSLEVTKENRSDNVAISIWQKNNIDQEGMDEEHGSVVFEPGKRFVEDNSQQLHLPCQKSASFTNMSVNNSSTQNTHKLHDWSLPFFLQKQNMNMVPGEKESTKKQSTPGSGWSNVLGLQHHQFFAAESQVMGTSSSEILHGSISQPASLSSDGYSHSSGVHIHNRELTFARPYDHFPQLPESHFSLQTQSLFHTETNAATFMGSCHDMTRKSIFLSTSTYHEKQPAYQPLGFPLTEQRTWELTANVGLMGAQQPTNSYKFSAGLPSELTVEGFPKFSKAMDYINSSLCFNSTPLNFREVKQIYDLCPLDMTADTELRLGRSDKLIRRKNEKTKNGNTNETEEKNLVMKTSEEMKREDRSLKGRAYKMEQSEKNQSIVSNIFGLHTLYTEDRASGRATVVKQAQTGNEEVSTKLIPDQDLKVPSNGFMWRKPASSELFIDEIGSTTVTNEGYGMCIPRLPEVNTSGNEGQDEMDLCNTSQKYNKVSCTEQKSLQMLQNVCQFYCDSQEQRFAQEINPSFEEKKDWIEIKADSETYRSSEAIALGFVTRDACEESQETHCDKEGLGCLGKEPGNMLSHRTLKVYSVETKPESRKDMTADVDMVGVRNVQLSSSVMETPNNAGSHASHCDALHVIEGIESCVSPNCNTSSLVPSNDAEDSYQVAEALLSLHSSFLVSVKALEDHASAEPEANAVPRDDHIFRVAQMKNASKDFIQKMDTKINDPYTVHCNDLRIREETSFSVQDRKKDEDAFARGSPDFFEFATIMLKASGTAIENSPNIVAREDSFLPLKKGKSARRNTGRKDNQKKSLPSIASLSGKKMGNIRGLMRSTNEVIMRSASVICRNELANASAGKCLIRAKAGIGGNDCITVKESEKRKSLSSWGSGTRRRRMRCHHSQW